MEQQEKDLAMLELIRTPAFCVEAGCICHVNQAAAPYLLACGTEIGSLILSGKEEYEGFTDGSLYLTLQIASIPIGACVLKMGGQDVFLLEAPENMAELRAMALAAKELREPLAGILTVTDRLLPKEAKEQAAQLNRRLFQMMRTVSNMSDALRYAAGGGRMEYVQITAFFQELLQRAGELLRAAGLTLEYTGPAEAVFTLADTERLERAVYNLLSNSAKFSPPGGKIQVRLQRKGNRLYLSVTDQGPGIDQDILGSLYTRFQREPALEDLRHGIGLGMVLVRSAAAAHNGAVLIDRPAQTGTRTSITLEIRHPKQSTVHSPALRIDYAGEWDHGLLELSDCLPAELYEDI